ncbi:hypothetical protein [Sphaerochaeta sp.]|uniref:hypothetical protein n=1 Tax=Sphaerochaeta sp. TaxID=1972642 RepID=UPI002FC70327
MSNANRTFTHLIDHVLMQCISIGSQDQELPSYLLQGQKAQGYLFDGQSLAPWYWKGISVIDGQRCLTFEPLPIFPFTELTTTRRSEALSFVRTLAKALLDLPSSFLDLSSGILPLWRIWAVEDGRILLLPQDIADLFASCADEETRYAQTSAWVHHGVHAPFSLCDQLSAILYYSASGIAPFAAKQTREDSFRPLPLSLMDTGLDADGVAFIDRTLTMSLTRQRDATGNKESQKALAWFLEQTEGLTWNLENRTQAPRFEDWKVDPQCTTFLQKQEKRANLRVFWRKKGWLVITVLVVATAVTWFTVNRIQVALTPPYTAGMPPVQIIEEYYAGQNALNLEKMEASLAKGTKDPAAMEVTNLFVTRQTRQAYEGINTQVDPNQWIADGKPAILEGTFLYGVTDLSVKPISENTYEAQGVLYTPYSYSDQEEQTDAGTKGIPIFTYDITQQFTIEMGKRGWYEITGISSPHVQLQGRIIVETYSRGANTTGLQ